MASAPDFLRTPLSWIFTAPSYIAILRVLHENRHGLSGRAIARSAGINHQACAMGLRTLESIGVVYRGGQGRAQWMQLNFQNSLVQRVLVPLFGHEKTLSAHWLHEISDKLRALALTATYLGPAKKKRSQAGNDIELLILVHPSFKGRSLQLALELTSDCAKKHGLHFIPKVLTVEEFREKVKKEDDFCRRAVREGVDLLERKLKDV